VTLRGVNARVRGIFDVTFADGRLPLEPIPVFDAGDAARMQALGFNLLRLPISWSALEPERGRYDDAYLDRIAAVTRLCGRRGILVLIDFHQDAFSKEIGEDGAPRWVLDLLLGPGGYPYLGGPLTDLLARRLSPAARDAFRGLFANRGGVQDALAAAAAAVAALPAAFPARPDGWETANLVQLATALVQLAARREESRGAHWREDFPDPAGAWRVRQAVAAAPDGTLVTEVEPVPSLAEAAR
jgi:endoglycosylceramidase